MKMKISEYIKELQKLLILEGDIELENITMDNEQCVVVQNGEHYRFNEYLEE